MPLRRRLAAVVVCLVLVLATVAYTVRSASEAASAVPSARAQCEQVKKDPSRDVRDRVGGCLVLYDD